MGFGAGNAPIDAATPTQGEMSNNNHRDAGTFATGMIMAFLMALSAIGGYWVRDIGITFKVDQVHQEGKR
ncbi:MAG: hypothetical protein LH702_26900 [Phormidesmis sp. CAN_BIN44]|nr:hypothetical protein [Phormidesmis sp. CAN_BIN44]